MAERSSRSHCTAPTLCRFAADTQRHSDSISLSQPHPRRTLQWEGKRVSVAVERFDGQNAILVSLAGILASSRSWNRRGQRWIRTEFWGSRDAPESLSTWPSDYRLRLTFRLNERSLRLDAEIDNPGERSLPFGLGYHPYFHIPVVPGSEDRNCLIDVRAREYWELEETLPTGRLVPVDATRNLTRPRPYPELKLDDLLRANPPAAGDKWLRQGAIHQQAEAITLSVQASPSFREVVVFTPPHRQAFCIEPYTCITDAINAQQRGLDAGLQVLSAGEKWSGSVLLAVEVG